MNAPSDPRLSDAQLLPGDPAPWFHQRSTSNPRYAFDTAAGRYIVLCFFGSAGDDQGRDAINAVLADRSHFDDVRVSFFGVSIDRADQAQNRVQESMPGIRFFWDFDTAVSRLYGAAPRDQRPGDPVSLRRFWIVLDPTLRVLKVLPLAQYRALVEYLGQLPPPGRFAGIDLQAPILLLPNVFEPEFCRHLIGFYEAHGGWESGFMREVNGKTVGMQDRNHKVRKDYIIADADLIKQAQARIRRRVVPEILKVHQFRVTRMERYIISCYAAEDGGHFRAHRETPRPEPPIAGLRSRSISIRSSRAAKSVSPSTGLAASNPRPVGPWCSRARCSMPFRA